MPALSHNEILETEDLGLVVVENRVEEVSNTSIDIRINQLYYHHHPSVKEFDATSLEPTTEEYLKTLQPVPLINDEFWIIKPGDFFLFDTYETFHLMPDFQGKINSRSSWARYGIAATDCTDEFSIDMHKEFHGRVLCTIRSLGTTVIIRPMDALAQAHLFFRGITPTLDETMNRLIRQDMLKIQRRGKKIKGLRSIFYENNKLKIRNRCNGIKLNWGFALTLDSIIKKYNGRIIDPHNISGDYFSEKRIPNQGEKIGYGTFFLSSSAEEVEIPPEFIGWVNEWNHLLQVSGFGGPKPLAFASSLQTHANAPKIDPYPYFKGKITFENYALTNTIIRPGQYLAPLELIRLLKPCIYNKSNSRYKDQQKATESR